MPVGANEPVRVDGPDPGGDEQGPGARRSAEGRFREDLYYRLNVVSITLPPLRERREDIPDLVEFLLAKHARSMGKKVAGVSHEAMQLLLACPWKGNVRELDNALQRAVILGDGPLVTPADLPPDLAPQPADPSAVDDLGKAVERFERLHIERMLRQTPDKREAAQAARHRAEFAVPQDRAVRHRRRGPLTRPASELQVSPSGFARVRTRRRASCRGATSRSTPTSRSGRPSTSRRGTRAGASPSAEAERRAWATVNKETGGGNKSGSGRGVPDTNVSSRKGGKMGGAASASRSAAERSASAKKAAATRKRNAASR